MTFIYNEDTRIHTFGNKIIPSVSQIIKPLINFDGIPAAILERKKELGINFHLGIELYVLDDLHIDSLDPDLTKPMNTFIQWEKSQNDRESAVYEVPLCHRTLRYCGKIDRVSDIRIVDFKLRICNKKTDAVQLAGYGGLVKDRPNCKERTVLSFDIEGNMKKTDVKVPHSIGIFRRMLERYYSELDFNNLMGKWKGVN